MAADQERVADLLAREEQSRLPRPRDLRVLRRAGAPHQAQAAGVPDRGQGAGKTICGYGAPGKGNTLLNYCGIGTDFLDFTVDRNPYKHGRFTPGMHIPIRPVEAIDAARPDYILILPWNLKDEIVQQMRHVADWGGKFVVPIPEVAIIDPKELSIMKVVLFCGGLGTRIREYSESIPEADDPGRPPADPVARHAVLQPVRAP